LHRSLCRRAPPGVGDNGPLHLMRAGSPTDLAQVTGGEFRLRQHSVFSLQAMQLRGARDRQLPRLLGQHHASDIWPGVARLVSAIGSAQTQPTHCSPCGFPVERARCCGKIVLGKTGSRRSCRSRNSAGGLKARTQFPTPRTLAALRLRLSPHSRIRALSASRAAPRLPADRLGTVLRKADVLTLPSLY